MKNFSDPIAVSKAKKMTSPFNFDAPPYDERSSCFVNAGNHYGVGHKQPVGREGGPKAESPTLPRHKASTMKVDQVPHKNERLEIRE